MTKVLSRAGVALVAAAALVACAGVFGVEVRAQELACPSEAAKV